MDLLFSSQLKLTQGPLLLRKMEVEVVLPLNQVVVVVEEVLPLNLGVEEEVAALLFIQEGEVEVVGHHFFNQVMVGVVVEEDQPIFIQEVGVVVEALFIQVTEEEQELFAILAKAEEEEVHEKYYEMEEEVAVVEEAKLLSLNYSKLVAVEEEVVEQMRFFLIIFN